MEKKQDKEQPIDIVHIDYGVCKDCINPDSYGEICVKCNACGRFGKETMWEARYNMYWWEIADILDNHSKEFCRSKLQQENIAKNLIFYGQRLLECAQNIDFDKAKIIDVKTFGYIALCEDVRNNAVRDICDICKHSTEHPDCPADCDECRETDCACRECLHCDHWEWRGEA